VQEFAEFHLADANCSSDQTIKCSEPVTEVKTPKHRLDYWKLGSAKQVLAKGKPSAAAKLFLPQVNSALRKEKDSNAGV
jgi:hypothetical protein